ncbi:MAG: hypothetical protein ABI083_09505 [Lapillicoccus sp.]
MSSTYRDEEEVHADTRRRVLAACLASTSDDPGQRVPRAGPVIASVVLSVALVLGAVIFGLVTGR